MQSHNKIARVERAPTSCGRTTVVCERDSFHIFLHHMMMSSQLDGEQPATLPPPYLLPPYLLPPIFPPPPPPPPAPSPHHLVLVEIDDFRSPPPTNVPTRTGLALQLVISNHIWFCFVLCIVLINFLSPFILSHCDFSVVFFSPYYRYCNR